MLWNSVVQKKQFELSLECALKFSQNKCALTVIFLVYHMAAGCTFVCVYSLEMW